MFEVQELLVEAKQKLAAFETRAKTVASQLEVDVDDLLKRFDHTQLRVAVHRLELFAAHVEQVIGDLPAKLEAEPVEEPADPPKVEEPKPAVKRGRKTTTEAPKVEAADEAEA